MLRRPALSLILAATLLFALAAPSPGATTHGAAPHHPESFWRAAWGWLASILPAPGPRTDRGCSIDPNGSCNP